MATQSADSGGKTSTKGDQGDTNVVSSADATSTGRVHGDVVVSDAASTPFSTKPGDVPADPRTGQPFAEGGGAAAASLQGQHGFPDADAPVGSVVPGVDPKRIPAEVTPGVTPDAGGNKLLAAAQAKAPSLTAEFVAAMGITDEMLGAIARGEQPPPPTPGPLHSADMYLTPAGFQQTPPGVKPADVGGNAISR